MKSLHSEAKIKTFMGSYDTSNKVRAIMAIQCPISISSVHV